jgi:hypothetical protein
MNTPATREPSGENPNTPEDSNQGTSDIRPKITMSPLSREEQERFADLDWASQDPEVQTRYPGEIVVPFGRKIVAHGTCLQAVLQEAEKATGCKAEELPVVAVFDDTNESSAFSFP